MTGRIVLFSFLTVCGLTRSQSVSAAPQMEPWTYTENFESREEKAWASYPLWQDTAYDDNFYPGEIVAGDPNISIVQYVTPYSHHDRYAGAQKALDMFLTPSSRITARYYIKSHLPAQFLKIRLAAGKEGAYEYTVPSPATNGWTWIDIGYADIVTANPMLAGRPYLKINGIAVLMKIPDADPDMPFYFGLDDVTITGARPARFAFAEPAVYTLAEWKPAIPKRHYKPGETLALSGEWPFEVDRTTVTITPFTTPDTILLQRDLTQSGRLWETSFPAPAKPGLYIATITAFKGKEMVASSECTILVTPPSHAGAHPRLWFDETGRKRIAGELAKEENKAIAEEIAAQASKHRADYPLEKMAYDFDQFPKDNWLVTRYSWSIDRIRGVGDAAYWNALTYSLLGDKEAGGYAKKVLTTYAGFPTWNHPWMIDRGRHFYLLIGDMAMYFAVAYDLTHDLMTDAERGNIRTAFMDNAVKGVHRTYVEGNLVTNSTSNWIAAIVGGSICCQAAIFGDSADTAVLEPYLTGAVFKMNALIQKSTGGDGGYGEGYNYYSYSSRSWSKSLPSLENVFGIDLSARLNGVYDELVWAGYIKNNRFFHNGDSRGNLLPMEAWAWLLPKYRDPLLGWLYYHTNGKETKTVSGFETFSKSGVPLYTIMQGKTLMDIIYNTGDAPVEPPFDRNPVRLFRDIGTTVFKSGWENDDFVFTLRTGPFYNHQHLDQGSFWLADRGTVFIGEHEGSSYYDDPLYESYYTQPAAHSTILVDGNPQSQRTGDPKSFIEGFNDHAFIYHFLYGEKASFVSGDIGKLYWGTVRDMKRNVLYLKPRTLLLIDTITPAEQDAAITELFQTRSFNDITVNDGVSFIGGGDGLAVRHLWPEDRQVETVEMPHFLNDFKEKPLTRRGCLTVAARTHGVPLVMAHLMSTDGSVRETEIVNDDGFISGTASGMHFAVRTKEGAAVRAGVYSTDALASVWDNEYLLVARCTKIRKDGAVILSSQEEITVELNGNQLIYSLAKDSAVTFTLPDGVRKVAVSGGVTAPVTYEHGEARMALRAGDGVITW